MRCNNRSEDKGIPIRWEHTARENWGNEVIISERDEDLVKMFIRRSVALGRHVVDSFVIKNPFRIEDRLERLEVAFKCALDMGFQFICRLFLLYLSTLKSLDAIVWKWWRLILMMEWFIFIFLR